MSSSPWERSRDKLAVMLKKQVMGISILNKNSSKEHQRAGYEGCNKIRIFSISYFVDSTRITSTVSQIFYFIFVRSSRYSVLHYFYQKLCKAMASL